MSEQQWHVVIQGKGQGRFPFLTVQSMIKEGKELFIRVKNESNDLELTKQAISMEALCALTLGQAQDVLELLGNRNKAILSPEGLLASAHQMLGEEIEAKKILQVGIYQHIMILFSILPTYWYIRIVPNYNN